MAILDKLKGLLKSDLLNQSSESVLGIDISSSSIKIVQLKKEGGVAVLETYGAIALGPYGDLDIGQATNLSTAQITSALTDLMKEANVTTKNCGVSIPFSTSLISFIEMPNLEHKELEKMIPIEARKYIPVPISEVQLDWFIIPEEESEYYSVKKDAKKVSVLLVAIHNEILQKYRSILKGAELKPSFFEIEVFSTIRASVGRGVNPVAIMDIGSSVTKIYIVEYGIVKSSHVINKGSQDITVALSKSSNMSFKKAEELKRTLGISDRNADEEKEHTTRTSLLTMDSLFSEAKKIILTYQRENNKNVGNIVFTGGGAGLKGIIDIAKKHFDVEVDIVDPFSKVKTPAFLESVLQQAGPGFAVAIGLALRKLQEME